MDRTEPGAEPPVTRYLKRRTEEKGFRPRFAAALIAGAWLVAIVIFGIIQHLVDPDSFDNVWLGMWWATQTVTTVGYGDAVPSQASGQVIAVVLMIGGLSLFAVITGTITSVFVARAQEATRRSGRSSEGAGEPEIGRRLDLIASELDALRGELNRIAPGREPPPGADDESR